MVILIMLFGILIAAAGLALMIKPNIIIEFLESHHQRAWVHVAAVVVRAFLGLLLISQFEFSKYPTVIEFFGWLSLIAALFLLIIGRSNFQRFMNWVISRVKPYARISGLLSATFGVFLVYSFI